MVETIKIAGVVVIILLVIVGWSIMSAKRPNGEPAATSTPTTPTQEPEITPIPGGDGTNMETPDIRIGAPNENLDLGSLV